VIKINLSREGRGSARTATAAPGAGAGMGAAPANVNNILVVTLVILGLLIGGGWTALKWNERNRKQATVNSMQAEADNLRKIIEEVERFERRRDSLGKRIALINQLKQNQKGPVRLLDHISRDLPDLVWLDTMALAGSQITISGRTLNPNAAATFVENIKADPMFDEPEFNTLSAEGGGQTGINVYRFEMRFNFRYLADAEPASSEGDAGSTDEAPQA
jgi:Tfp pilus assembly protein PilN